MAQIESSSKQSLIELPELQWNLFKTLADEVESPAQLLLSHQVQKNAMVPGTVASTLKAGWEPTIDYDDFDWWYQSALECPSDQLLQNIELTFEGLATFCEVWINEKLVLTTDNMFKAYHLNITQYLKAKNTISLRFRALNQELTKKKPRPKWKTKLVENQQMRWVRATVLGHVDVWTPPIRPIGPWRNITLATAPPISSSQVQLIPYVEQGTAKLKVIVNNEAIIANAKQDDDKIFNQIAIMLADHRYTIDLNEQPNNGLEKSFEVADVALWWPHTHGDPALYDYEIFLINASSNSENLLTRGQLGFKEVNFKTSADETSLSINGEKIFCRGACWTVSDYQTLNASREVIHQQLSLLKNAGGNMIRVGGTMVYESNEFYSVCDELGILVWQDFMFASMDYPFEDEQFAENVKLEVSQQVSRLSQFTSIAIYCGNTDIKAQAAMYGVPEALWSNQLFSEWIPSEIKHYSPNIPYIESSPQDGVMPFHLNQGVSHFWGVGAYMHNLSTCDASSVHFASEGMGLSHIPEDNTITNCIGKQTLFPFNNQWTKRIPRDLGAGWDFDDIRNFYLQSVFNVDPVVLKRSNVNRYIEISRIITGEMIANVFKQWRKYDSHCNGGIIWFFRDFWPCAGFGLIDSDNQPKAAIHQLKQVWSNQQVLLHNEGLNGISASIINETQTQLAGKLEISIIKDGSAIIAQAEKDVLVPANDKLVVNVEDIIGYFIDAGNKYRFGPPQFDQVIARLLDTEGNPISQDVEFNGHYDLPIIESPELEAELEVVSPHQMKLILNSSHFLQFVHLQFNDFLADENYFHLAPSKSKTITLNRMSDSGKRLKGELKALNMNTSIKIKVPTIN